MKRLIAALVFATLGLSVTVYAYQPPAVPVNAAHTSAVEAAGDRAADTYTISGVVRKFDGTPIPYVTVMYSGPESGSTSTDFSGIYTIIVSAGTYQVSVLKQDYPSLRDQTVTVPPSRTDVNFTFPELFAVGGTVRDYDGSPMVWVHVTASEGPQMRSTTTDYRGRYTLNLVAGTYRVSASDLTDPSPPAQTVAVPPSRTDVNFTFPERYTVAGTVRDYDGSPLPNVWVTAAGQETRSTNTDLSGAYTLTVGAGSYRVSVSDMGHLTPPDQFVTVPPSRNGVDFTFLDPTVGPADPLQLWIRYGLLSTLAEDTPNTTNTYECRGGPCTFSWPALLGGDIPGNGADTIFTLNVYSATVPFTATLTLRRGAAESTLAEWSGNGQVIGPEITASAGDRLILAIRLAQAGKLIATSCGAECDGSYVTLATVPTGPTDTPSPTPTPPQTPSATPTSTSTATATSTATPILSATASPTFCPRATAEPLWVEPVTSPTDQLSQVVIVRIGNGEAVTITAESGTFATTGDFNAYSNPARVTVALLPDTTHHLSVQAKVRSLWHDGCPWGGYTLSTTRDRHGAPLIIVQSSNPSPSPTPTATPTATVTPTPTPTRFSTPPGGWPYHSYLPAVLRRAP